MDLNYLIDLVNAKINDDARRGGVMTLGGLRDVLAALPSDLPVAFDGGGSPGQLDSYRGYYERLAFDRAGGTVTTVADVLDLLNDADGRTFYGYKGGEYGMDSSTFLHVAEYGDCGPFVSGVRVEQERVVVETAEEEW